MLPELKYLEIKAYRQNMDWPKFSSLTHVALNTHFPKPFQLPSPFCGTLPMLSYLYFSQCDPPISASSIGNMLSATPNLRTLVYVHGNRAPKEHELWTPARSSSFQRFEIHFQGWFDSAVLRGLALPFANPQKFPAFSCFKLRGSRNMQGQLDDLDDSGDSGDSGDLDGLDEMEAVPDSVEIVNRALTGLTSGGIQVLIER